MNFGDSGACFKGVKGSKDAATLSGDGDEFAHLDRKIRLRSLRGVF